MAEIRIRRRPEEDEQPRPTFSYYQGWPYLTIGFGSERDYFIENLSLLVASGMGISASLASIRKGVKNRRFKKLIVQMEEMIQSGFPLWRTFKELRFFPERVIALIKAGEESGKLPEHLSLVTIQQHKERVFSSRVRSALLYPGIVLLLAIVVAIGSAWYTLPRLTLVLQDAAETASIPITTKVLIWLGQFIASYGVWAIPALLVGLFLVVYLLFVNNKTKWLGDTLILGLPGIDKLVQGVEVSRFGFVFGALLQAGLPLRDAVASLVEGTSFVSYKNFYRYLQVELDAGQTFANAFDSYKKSGKYIPIPMQQLIVAAEQSGKLPETLLKIGQIFEEKTDVMSRDLSTVLEPMVLIIVGLIVAMVVMGVLGPIYNLAGGLG